MRLNQVTLPPYFLLVSPLPHSAVHKVLGKKLADDIIVHHTSSRRRPCDKLLNHSTVVTLAWVPYRGQQRAAFPEMVKFYPSIEENHADFIRKQSVFFVASAPLAGDHINLSPKGHPDRSFAILDANTVAYLDATGSGCETISHVYENGRVTVMFCSFDASPQIMRLFCRGRVVERDEKGFKELKTRIERSAGNEVELIGTRAIILLDVFEVQTSCGFGVPLAGQTDELETGTESGKDLESGRFTGRNTLDNWASKMSEKNALLGYQKNMNFRSLDGLTGMRSARRARGQWILLEDLKTRMRRVGRQWDALLVGVLITLLLISALHIAGVVDVEAKSFHH